MATTKKEMQKIPQNKLNAHFEKWQISSLKNESWPGCFAASKKLWIHIFIIKKHSWRAAAENLVLFNHQSLLYKTTTAEQKRQQNCDKRLFFFSDTTLKWEHTNPLLTENFFLFSYRWFDSRQNFLKRRVTVCTLLKMSHMDRRMNGCQDFVK